MTCIFVYVLAICPVILSPAILSLSLPVFGSPNNPCSQVFITVRTGNGHYVRHVVLYGDPPTLPSSHPPFLPPTLPPTLPSSLPPFLLPCHVRVCQRDRKEERSKQGVRVCLLLIQCIQGNSKGGEDLPGAQSVKLWLVHVHTLFEYSCYDGLVKAYVYVTIFWLGERGRVKGDTSPLSG